MISLLHFDDHNNIFKDEFNNISYYHNSGSLTISEDNKKFGTSSMNLSGGTITTSTFSSKNGFTVDFWFYTYAYAFYEILFGVNEHSNSNSVRIQRENRNGWFYFYNTGDHMDTTGISVSNNVWNHFAYVYDNNNKTIKLYINGINAITRSYSYNDGDISLSFGVCNYETRVVYSYYDELRICTNVVYNGDFDVPERPYALIDYYRLFDENSKLYQIK